MDDRWVRNVVIIAAIIGGFLSVNVMTPSEWGSDSNVLTGDPGGHLHRPTESDRHLGGLGTGELHRASALVAAAGGLDVVRIGRWQSD
jgi:hypothetical protein